MKTRRQFIHQITVGSLGMMATASAVASLSCSSSTTPPNILFAISDDQSWAYAGAYGSQATVTPNFDRVAREGVLFKNAFCVAPQCSPSRAAILTGRNTWQLEEAGSHASSFPAKFQVYPDLLEKIGYFIGYTGKPWGPGNWEAGGRKRNPAGPEYNRHVLTTKPYQGISDKDYAANFAEFLAERQDNQPFCFWYGGHEPHRRYEKESGLQAGKKLEDADVPAFLPDVEEIRSDILDYAVEIEWFDSQLGKMLTMLEERGELDSTLVVVTSDNGMPFPRAKANNYEYGTHMPLAIRWPERIKGGRMVEDLVSFVDFAPTFLQAAGLQPPDEMTGRSILDILTSDAAGRVDATREYVLTGRERHTHARPENFAYPCRAIRTYDYLFIHNVHPERWPAGDPTGSGDPEGYHDIDASPTKSYMIDHQHDDEVDNLFVLGYHRRPEEELYDVRQDPDCLHNLAGNSAYRDIQEQLRDKLHRLLTEQGDPRMLGYGDVFESYPRYSRMRQFDGFKLRGQYNPDYQVKK